MTTETEAPAEVQQTPGAESSKGCCRRNPYTPICRFPMLWMSLTTAIFMIVGLVSPGWLRVQSKIVMKKYSDLYYVKGYQDYGLWTVTQCLKSDYDLPYQCQTETYNLLSSLDDKNRMGRLDIKGVDLTAYCFNGIPLIIGYEMMWILQTLYVLGTMFAVFNVYMAFELRSSKYTVRFCTAPNQQTAIAISLIPACLAFVPVFVFVSKGLNISDGGMYRDELKPSTFGIAFAGIGCALFVLYSFYMFAHVCCCGCSCLKEPLITYNEDGEPMEVGDTNKEPLCAASTGEIPQKVEKTCAISSENETQGVTEPLIAASATNEAK